MKAIHPQYHKDIKNRRLQKSCVNEFRGVKGLKSTKGAASKDMMDIADLEDECLVKLRDMGLTNF